MPTKLLSLSTEEIAAYEPPELQKIADLGLIAMEALKDLDELDRLYIEPAVKTF